MGQEQISHMISHSTLSSSSLSDFLSSTYSVATRDLLLSTPPLEYTSQTSNTWPTAMKMIFIGDTLDGTVFYNLSIHIDVLYLLGRSAHVTLFHAIHLAFSLLFFREVLSLYYIWKKRENEAGTTVGRGEDRERCVRTDHSYWTMSICTWACRCVIQTYFASNLSETGILSSPPKSLP